MKCTIPFEIYEQMVSGIKKIVPPIHGNIKGGILAFLSLNGMERNGLNVIV